jgi:hypothetical protein
MLRQMLNAVGFTRWLGCPLFEARDAFEPTPAAHIVVMSNSVAREESKEVRRRFIRNADDFVRCLTIELEVELGLGSTVVPVGKTFELGSPKASLRKRGAFDGDTHARCLPGDPGFVCDRFCRGDDAACDETWSAFVLARENKDRIALGDVLATIHRLLRAERRRIANLGFDREDHTHFAPWFGQGLTDGKSAAGQHY